MLAEDFAYVYATQKQGMWMVRQYKALNFDGVQFYLRLLIQTIQTTGSEIRIAKDRH